MGRNRDTACQLPVDEYRKKIGKQDARKSQAKNKKQGIKNNAVGKPDGPGEILKLGIPAMAAVLVALLGVYAFFYYSLAN